MVKKKRKKPEKSIFLPKGKGNFITIKTSLKSIIKDFDTNYPIINNLVIECNDIVIRTYQFIRLFILHKYGKNETLPTLDRNNILYFIRAGGVRDKRGRQATNSSFEKELDIFYKNEFQPCIQKERYNLQNKTHIISYLAIQIQTGFNNNLKEHFITRFRRFMNVVKPFEDIDKQEWNKIKNLVLLDKLDQVPDKYKQWAKNIKKNYLPEEYEKVYGYDVKVNPNKYLFYTIKMNEEIEKRNNKIKNSNRPLEETKFEIKKLFQPIPLRNSIVPNYITLDTNVILSLFKKKGESALGKETTKNKEYIWNKVFRTDKKVMKMKYYEYKSIQTDGMGVSICFQKVGRMYKETDNKEGNDEYYISDLNDDDLKLCKNKKIVSIDPGKNSLVYMADGDKNKLRYTASQRRIESLRKRCNKIILSEKVKNKIIEEETKLSSYNCKTVNYNEFKGYLKEKTILNDKLKDFYQKELFRKMKWRTWVYGRKSEDNFLNRIEDTFGYKDDILLCYGDWSNNKQMKYIMPTKGVGLRRIIKKKFDVVLIDEFRTSKLCSKCYNELSNYKHIHRLLVCQGCNKSNGSESKNVTFMNRDMNACMNMIYLSNEWINKKVRPEMFNRTSNIEFLKENIKLG
jgi:hypothetical protein